MGDNNDVRACRLCLACDVKIFLIDSCLENSLRTFLGQNITYTSGLPKYACYECTALLKKIKWFKNKCLVAQTVLFSLLKLQKVVTENSIKKIDRKKISLLSNLHTTKIDVHSFTDSAEGENKPYEADIESVETGVFLQEDYLDNDDMENGVINDSDLHTYVVDSKMDVNGLDLSCEEDHASDNEDNMTLHKVAKMKKSNTVSSGRKGYTSKSSKKKKSTKKITTNKITAKEMAASKRNIKITAEKLLQVSEEKDVNFWDLANDFTINILSLEEQKAAIEQRKNSDFFKLSEFKCDLCYKGYSEEDKYLSHMKCHNPELQVVCEVCRARFCSEAELVSHAAEHSRGYSCNRCSYGTTQIHQAKLHRQSHKAADVIRNGVDSIKMETDGLADWSYACDQCGKGFPSKRSLVCHKNRSHRDRTRKKTPEHDDDDDDCEAVDSDPNDVEAAGGSESDHSDWDSKPSVKAKSELFCKKCRIQFSTKAAWKRHKLLGHKKAVIKKPEYDPSVLVLATHAVRLGVSKAKAARTYNIPRSTLHYRLSQNREINGKGPAPIFTPDEEKGIVRWVIDTEPKNVEIEVREKVKEMLKNDPRASKFIDGAPGRKWFTGLRKRQPELNRWMQLRKLQ